MNDGGAMECGEASTCAHKAALAAAVQAMLARDRRHVRVRQVIAKLRRHGNHDAAAWAESLQGHDLNAVLDALWTVHAVIDDAASGESMIVPATLGWPPGSQGGEIDFGRWGPPPASWVRRSRVLVHTAAQCRAAVADLRARPFVSVVIDASPQHDLGLVHVAALGDDRRPARCYTFDVCATPMTEWNGGAHLFDSGGLAHFLGDPAVPKAVCGSGPAHDRVAHALARHLRRPSKAHPLAGAIQDREGGRNLLVRNTAQVLPVAGGDGDDGSDRVVDASMRAHMLNTDAWRAAGAAPRGDRWYWIRRPLSSRALDNCAERAFALCVAYDALATAPAAMGQPATDSLLCIAAAQTAASTKWPDRVQRHARREQDRGCGVVKSPGVLPMDGSRSPSGTKDRAVTDSIGRRQHGGDVTGVVAIPNSTRHVGGERDADTTCRARFDTHVAVGRCTRDGVGGTDVDATTGAVLVGDDGDHDTRDWEELCRAVDMYTSGRAHLPETDDDDSNVDDYGKRDDKAIKDASDNDDDDWYGDGRDGWTAAESDLYEAP